MLRAGIASLHGINLMDILFTPPAGVARFDEVLGMHPGGSFTQRSLERFQSELLDYADHPSQQEHRLDAATRWRVLGEERPVELHGRLVGGCLDIAMHLVGTPYADMEGFARRCHPDPLLLYLENCELSPAAACRAWLQVRHAGWLDHAAGLLIGRTRALATIDGFAQQDAVSEAFGDLAVPVLYDLDIGHSPPQHLLVNGALATVTYDNGRGDLRQDLR